MCSHRLFVVLLVLVVSLVVVGTSLAQDDPIPVQCGTILEDEFSPTIQERRYSLSLSARDIVSIEVLGVADELGHLLYLDTSTGSGVGYDSSGRNDTKIIETLGATDDYLIRIRSYDNAIGLYTLSIGCTLADGTVIEPGDAPPPPTPEPLPLATYPDLAPLDLSAFTPFPIALGTPAPALFSPSGAERYAFSFTGMPDQTVEIQVDRTMGNLNVGLVIVDPSGGVIFYGGLLLNSSLTIPLTLTADGSYQIGVFQPGLQQRSEPQPTVAQITLNVAP